MQEKDGFYETNTPDIKPYLVYFLPQQPDKNILWWIEVWAQEGTDDPLPEWMHQKIF